MSEHRKTLCYTDLTMNDHTQPESGSDVTVVKPSVPPAPSSPEGATAADAYEPVTGVELEPVSLRRGAAVARDGETERILLSDAPPLDEGVVHETTVASDAPLLGEQVFIDAWNAAEPEPAAPAPSTRGRAGAVLLREVLETAILALLIFLGVRAVVQNFRVEGASMDPTYATGQYVLVNKALYSEINLETLSKFVPFWHSSDTHHHLFRGPDRGEVIVFHPPLTNSFDRDFIKRVIGLPGDHIQVKDSKIYINGQLMQEPYLPPINTFCGGPYCDLTLGPDQYYVMGDNRTNSSDSRLWGPVTGDKIIGKTWWIYLPFNKFGKAPGGKPELVPAPAPSPGTSAPPSPALQPAPVAQR